VASELTGRPGNTTATSTVCSMLTTVIGKLMLTHSRRILDITQILADPKDFDRLRLENDERQKQRDAEA
jgi:hypothetical protein